MQAWFAQLVRGPVPGAVVVAGVFTFIAAQLVSVETKRPGLVASTHGALTLAEGQAIASRVVGELQGSSAHHIRIAEGVDAHYHAVHDETVVILTGRGTMTLGEESQEVEPGSVILIPRGTIHSFRVSGEPVEALSVFAPAFDGKDRIFVD
jgi:mannose-6-phosphate isomerase-like protein (cupin superfamily)